MEKIDDKMPRYSLIINLNESVKDDPRFVKSVEFLANGVAAMFGGSEPELRLPIFPRHGINYCIRFSNEQNYKLASKQVKKTVKENNMGYISIDSYEDEPKERKITANKPKKVKKTIEKRKSTKKPTVKKRVRHFSYNGRNYVDDGFEVYRDYTEEGDREDWKPRDPRYKDDW